MRASFTLISVFIDEKLGFRGNTTAVVKLERALTEERMQLIAEDFNQPATTFLWEDDSHLKIRWFAPDSEIGLCGHGSAGAFAFMGLNDETVLNYNSGTLFGKKIKDENKVRIWIDAISVAKKLKVPKLLAEGLGVEIENYYATDNKHIVLLKNEAALKSMKPNFSVLKQLETFGYSVTAPGDDVDFVSRTIIPHVQQLEDPATGSSHAALVPFWAERLGKESFTAHQLSKRGGAFYCEISANNQVMLESAYKILAQGELNLG